MNEMLKNLLLARSFILLGLVVFSPNVTFWLASWFFDLNRPLLNLDYFLAGVFLAAGWRLLGIGFLSAFMLIDLLSVTGLLFPFVRIQDVGYLLGLLPYAGFVWQILAGTVFLLMLAVVVLSALFGRKISLAGALVALNVALLAYGAHVYAPESGVSDRWYRASGRLIESQTLFFLKTRSTVFFESARMSGDPLIQTGFKGATARWVTGHHDDLSKKILLVVAESWGRVNDERVQEALLEPLTKYSARFKWFEEGEMIFSGVTVGAELRELCGLDVRHYNLKPVVNGFSGCLPWRLKELGYTTSAVHGAVGVMYDRVYWYPRAGFDLMMFKESGGWKSQCYSFPGACDWEIMDRYVSKVFEGDQKRFVYWLTLNTHAIYDSRDIREDFIDCVEFDLPENSETCRMVKLHAQFFHGLGEMLAKDSMKGVEVLIVGDHEPRIFNAVEKQTHIKDNVVSWVHLKVKD